MDFFLADGFTSQCHEKECTKMFETEICPIEVCCFGRWPSDRDILTSSYSISGQPPSAPCDKQARPAEKR